MKFTDFLFCGLTFSLLMGCAGPGKVWKSAEFKSKSECKAGVRYLFETEENPSKSRPEKIEYSCKRKSEDLYIGKFLRGYQGPFNDSLKRTPDLTINVESPNPDEVTAYSSKKTESLDASTQIERKIP